MHFYCPSRDAECWRQPASASGFRLFRPLSNSPRRFKLAETLDRFTRAEVVQFKQLPHFDFAASCSPMGEGKRRAHSIASSRERTWISVYPATSSLVSANGPLTTLRRPPS